jgi:hypothetical protein
MGCNATLVIRSLWPSKVNLAGALGNPSSTPPDPPIDPELRPVPPPQRSQMLDSLSYLTWASRSLFYFISLALVDHLASRLFILLLVAVGSAPLATIPASEANISAD